MPAAKPATRWTRQCWCDNQSLAPFSDGYCLCLQCETLVSTVAELDRRGGIEGDDPEPRERARAEYEVLPADTPERARADLAGRCLFWLKALLKYRTPPGRVLEIGSGHGAFVAMLRWAGFDATGLDIDRSNAAIARELFDVPLLPGPLEDQEIDGAFDAVVLLHTLERLPDPLATLRHAVSLLRPDGLLLVETPNYPSGRLLQNLVDEHHRFVERLKPREHVHLFSQNAIGRLFRQLGCTHFLFEPPFASDCDMLLVASREPRSPLDSQLQEQSLLATPVGHLVLAAIELSNDLHESTGLTGRLRTELGGQQAETSRLRFALEACEGDRAARLELINKLGADVGRISAEMNNLRTSLAVSEADRTARLAEMNDLRTSLAVSEADRAARLEVIQRQGDELQRAADALKDRDLLEQRVRELTAAQSTRPVLARLLGRLRR